MSAIEKYESYMAALGVSPGDNAQTVKSAFRRKIKTHHPDTASSPDDTAIAQTLIEAYSAFKKGVPHVKVDGRTQSPVKGRSPDSGLYHRANLYRKHTARTGHAATSEELGRAAGKRVFDSVFGNRSTPFNSKGAGYSALDGAWENLSDMLWGDVPETHVYGEYAEVREYRPQRARSATAFKHNTARQHEPFSEELLVDDVYTNIPGSFQGSRNMLKRAESNLRDVVGYFEEAGIRKFSKSWMREYVAALSQVQIRFRDVSKYHAAFSARALRRVRQIGELISEIKISVK